MTSWNDVKDAEKCIKVLDKGFVRLVDNMGNDQSVVQAARVSYGDGTKSVREDRGLIRYLFKHKHTSPFEMVQFKFHIKCPIFVMRQLVRHRTASLNEYSGRYSVMTDEYYLPHVDDIKPQSDDNKQGRKGDLPELDAHIAQDVIREQCEDAYTVYQQMLRGHNQKHPLPITIPDSKPPFSDEFPGIAKELARTILPVAYYTELYWSQNLRNIFHLLNLRMDGHAQWEIQELARAMYALVEPVVPLSCEAFEDYQYQSANLSRMEVTLMNDLMKIKDGESVTSKLDLLIQTNFSGNEDALNQHYGFGKRELQEFRNQWN